MWLPRRSLTFLEIAFGDICICDISGSAPPLSRCNLPDYCAPVEIWQTPRFIFTVLTRVRRVPCETFCRSPHQGFGARHPRVAGGPRLREDTATTNPWGRRMRCATGRAQTPTGHRDTGDITKVHLSTVAPTQLVNYAASMGDTPPPCFTTRPPMHSGGPKFHCPVLLVALVLVCFKS